MRKHRLHRIAVAILAASALVSAQASARSASQMSDLVGARAGQSEAEVEARGFISVDGHEGRGSVYSYWWHARDKNCIQIRTNDGRYASITDAPNSDCNQKIAGGNAGAAIAGAAIGALLIAALASHKSSHHDDGNHLSDQAAEHQYERGYNDGVHNASYHNYDRSDAYSSGYRAGVDQRNRNIGSHSGRGGYAVHTPISDLRGMNAVSAIDAMSERGFRNVDSISSGNTLYGIFWKGSTGQCVQMTNSDSRVYDIREIGSHPNCRN
jgi:hypothetical protein